MVHTLNPQIVVFTTIYKPHIGGLERYVEKFYKNIPGRRIYIISCRLDKKLSKVQRDGNTIILRYNAIKFLNGKYFIPNLFSVFRIYWLFKKRLRKPLVMHTHTRFYVMNFLALIISTLRRKKLFHFEHGTTFVKDGSGLVQMVAWLYDQTFSRILLNNTDVVLPIGELTRKFLVEKLHFDQYKFGPILPIGIDSYELDRDRTLIGSRLKLLFVGRLVRSKGIFELIDCCNELKRSGKDFELTMFGSGSDIDSLENYIKELHLESQVHVLGSVTNEIVLRAYVDQDIMINPSYSEGGPTTVLEALVVDMPIISTKVGVTEQVLNAEALIPVEDLSGKELAQAVLKYSENWESTVNEHKGYGSFVRDNFSWEGIVKNYLLVEDEILRREK